MEQRYSEKRVSEDFSIYVLFSEPLVGRVAEVMAAVAEDYPGIDWSAEQVGGEMIDTRSVTLSTDMGGAFGGDADIPRGLTTFMSAPGRCEIDWRPVIGKSRFIFPEAGQAVDRHTDHLHVRVGSPKGDTSLAARFDAARRVTCIGAVLANLPTALAVYFPNGDTIVKPEKWVRAAETAMKGEVPVLEWMTIFLSYFDEPGEPKPVTVSTIGMAAFNGHEVVMPRARLEGAEAAQWAVSTARMLIEADNEFVDGDTLGVEGDGRPVRIRHMAEGDQGLQTDCWMLIHDSSGIDDEDMFGPRSRRPAPAGVPDEIMGDWGSLKKKLYSYLASGAR